MKKLNQLTRAVSLAVGGTLLMASGLAHSAEFVTNTNLGGAGPANFTFTKDGGYFGAFEYEGQQYGAAIAPNVTNTIDLKTFAADEPNFYQAGTYNGKGSDTGGEQWHPEGPASSYRIYRQNYSVVIGNNAARAIADRDQNRNFIRHVVGNPAPLNALAGSGTLVYTGQSFNHINEVSEHVAGANLGVGDFNYTITKGAAPTGQGSFGNLLMDPANSGDISAVGGTLHQAAIQNVDGTLRVVGGHVTVSAATAYGDGSDVVNKLNGQSATYNLGVYGPQAQEVAGNIDALVNADGRNIGGIGLAGKVK